MHWIKVEPRYVEAQGPPLSTEVSFVRIDPGDWKLPQDNQRVSSLVFQTSPITIVVGCKVTCPDSLTNSLKYVAKNEPSKRVCYHQAPILFFNLSLQTMLGGVSEIAQALTSESNKGWAKGIGTAAKFAGPAMAIASIYLQEDVPSAQELHEEVREFILLVRSHPEKLS